MEQCRVIPPFFYADPAWCPTSPKCIVALCLRVSFGLSLAFVGLTHYLTIPAGMLLKSVIGGLSLADTMPAAINAFVWIIVYLLVIKMSCCGSGTCDKPGMTSTM